MDEGLIMAERVLNSLKRLNRGVAILVGIMLLTCAAVVLADIVLRQVGSSLGGTDEISGYAMAIATSWGMGYALMELGHVRIDLLRSRAGTRGRVLFDLFSMLVLSGTVSLIAVKCWPVLDRYRMFGFMPPEELVAHLERVQRAAPAAAR